MRKTLFWAIIALVAASCSNKDEILVNNDELVPVKVHIDGFNVSQEEFPGTRAASEMAGYTGVKAVTLAFYNGATETSKTTQLRDDATTYTTFGDFECSLPMGSYTMVVVAYTAKDGSPFVLTSPTLAAYTGEHAYETFAATQTVNITSNSAVDISATLNRVISCLQVLSTDGRTANVSNIRMTVSAGGKSFNPTTGLATSDAGFANTVSISTAVGATTWSQTFLFLATDEETMDVTIETLDSDGNALFTKSVKDVPLKRNRVTKLTGAMYANNGVEGGFKVETAWLSEEDIAF